MSTLQSCWEIMNCGRHKGGPKVNQLGECIASCEGMGHSCWEIAGTMCGGIVSGTAAQKEHYLPRLARGEDLSRAEAAAAMEVLLAYVEGHASSELSRISYRGVLSHLNLSFADGNFVGFVSNDTDNDKITDRNKVSLFI